MSLKQVSPLSISSMTKLTEAQEIETWVSALGQYDNHEFEEALKTFDRICDTSKILFNCGMIHATLGQHAQAVSSLQLVEWVCLLTIHRLNVSNGPSEEINILRWHISSRASQIF